MNIDRMQSTVWSGQFNAKHNTAVKIIYRQLNEFSSVNYDVHLVNSSFSTHNSSKKWPKKYAIE